MDTLYDASFYFTAFAISFIAGTVTTFSDHYYKSFWDILAAGCIAGFSGSASIALLVGTLGGINDLEPRYLGLAALVGLTGKRSLKIAYHTLDIIMEKFGISDDIQSTRNSSTSDSDPDRFASSVNISDEPSPK